MAKLLFWISIAAVFYTYIGYPALIALLARLRNLKSIKAPITPRVSVVVACHNEEDCIEARINNLLESDYPQDLLEIMVVSDGSTDRTVKIASSLASRGVRVIVCPYQQGKAVALNAGVAQATGEIIIFADARQSFEPGAIKELAANFADPTTGAVSGKYILAETDGSTVRDGVGLYWKYEEWIRRNEARFNSVVGATGAIYAIRRRLFEPLPPGTILDDVYTPVQIALAGHRVILDEKARAYDRAPVTTAREFSRKVRTLTGNYQLCQLMPRVLLPTSRLAFQFYSHKLMRLVAPILMLLILATNIVIAAGASNFAGDLFYDANPFLRERPGGRLPPQAKPKGAAAELCLYLFGNECRRARRPRLFHTWQARRVG
jgi:cellulose synthase/poly-beta-1,6-N-acetylglucosamine synthase-like glycosyltransferase